MSPKKTKMELEEVTENTILKLFARASIPFILGLCVWMVNSQVETLKAIENINGKLEGTKDSVIASNSRIDETRDDLRELERRVNEYFYRNAHKVGLTAGGGNGG